jgi:RES domain-containing protein
MRLWRLADPRFARDLSGEGSRLFGGRWNAPGVAVAYTSEHLSLAVLETLAHLPGPLRERLPPRMAVEIEIPDDAPVSAVNALPHKLKPEALSAWCQSKGSAWLSAGEALLLRVPSVLVPQEFNVVINVRHPAMRHVRIVKTTRFAVDGRLLR